jgi:hypothetical protein
MRKSARFALLAVASVIALGLAGTAMALYKPYLTIYEYSYKPAATPPVEVDYDQAKTEPAPAKVTIIVPAGYGMDLTQAQNTNIGRVVAQVQTGASSPFAGAVIPLGGPITVAKPSDYAAGAAQCTGNPVHAAVWTLNLTVAGQTLVVPAYVDKPGPAGTAGTIVFCLPNPYIPESSGGAQFGAYPLSVSMTFLGSFDVFMNPTAPTFYTWTSIVTPWNTGAGPPNAAATVEARANVPIPYSNTLKRTATKKGMWIFAGKLTGGGGPFVKEKLDVYQAATVAKLGKLSKPTFRTRPTTKKGGYSFSRKAGRSAMYFQSVFGPFDVTDATTCGPPSPAPAGCATATLSEVDSNIVKAPGVKPKPKKKKH